MWGQRILGCSIFFACAVACGGAEPAAVSPDEASASAPECHGDCETTARATSDADAAKPPSEDAAKPSSEDAAKSDPKASNVASPEFKENGSVLEAINAVPQGTQRLNIEQEALGRPLGNVELYEPCKPPSNAHFKAKVAVWDGKAVGLDLTTTPKNQKFADCIAERIRSVTWPDKVKSLNVVEYTF